MPTGFGQEKQSSVSNYETIFEKIKTLTDGEDKPWTWYRREVKKIALSYKRQPQKFIREDYTLEWIYIQAITLSFTITI